MVLALRELARAARPGARLILVLGRESTVCGARFFNGELVGELEVQGVGLAIEQHQERVFRNRFGRDICEDILHFRAAGEIPNEDCSLAAARRIAAQVLSATRPHAPPEERPGLDYAMARLDEIPPRPMPIPAALSSALA